MEAKSVPFVVLTSNGTRELSDALRRRCLYHYVDYPDEAKELRILDARLPGIAGGLASQVVRFVQAIRKEDIRKKPGIAETIDWASALMGLGVEELRADPDAVHDTLLCLLKTAEDRAAVSREVVQRLADKVA